MEGSSHSPKLVYPTMIFVGKEEEISERKGNLGPINLPFSSFVFCFLHARLRITEKLLKGKMIMKGG